MNRLTIPRLTALSLACCAGLTLGSAVHASHNGKLLTGNEVPDWAVGNQYQCSGTLVTPRVVISSAECLYSTGYFHRKTGLNYSGTTIPFPAIQNVWGNVSVFITDEKFGGSSSIETAPVASYAEQRKKLINGNDSLTEGARLEFYTTDSLGVFPGQRANRQMRLIDAYVDWSTYKGNLSAGDVVPDGPPLIYRSMAAYMMSDFEFANTFSYLFDVAGPGFAYFDVDDAIILTAGLPDWSRNIDPPIRDSGAGIFLREANGKRALVGTSFRGWGHVRLSHYWPWVVKTLVDKGLHDDARILSQKVLGTSEWGDHVGEFGQIFVYDNPYSRRLEYMRLVNVAANGSYGAFPINQRDNETWEYLGTDLPDMEQATRPVRQWNPNNLSEALGGEFFVYNNPHTHDVEYFRLKASGRYSYFPTNKTSNAEWTYLGTNLPTREMKFAGLNVQSDESYIQSGESTSSAKPGMQADQGIIAMPAQ